MIIITRFTIIQSMNKGDSIKVENEKTDRDVIRLLTSLDGGVWEVKFGSIIRVQ